MSTAGATTPVVDEHDEFADRVLEAARELFLTFGIRRTTVDDIARAAGVGRATIYRRFDGRDGVISEVVNRETQQFLARIEEPVRGIRDPRERFVEGFVATIREARRQPLLARLMDIEFDLLAGFMTKDAGPGLALARTYLAGQFAVGQQRGHIPADVRVDLVAEMLVRLCHSILLTPDGRIGPDEDGLRRIAADMFVPVLFRTADQPQPGGAA